MKQFLIIILFALLFYNVKAQNSILNKSYVFSKKEFKIFLTPYFYSGANYYNDLFFKTFNRDCFSIVDTGKIVQNISNDESFNNVLRNTGYTDIEDSYLKRKYNIFSSLNADEVANFKNSSLDADLMIALSQIRARTTTYINNSGKVVLTGYIIVFDLTTGEFIIKITNSVTKKYAQMSPSIIFPVEELANSLFESLKENIK